MFKRKWLVVLVMIIIAVLSSCFGANESDFPTYFTRLSDGAQIYLGMTRDEIELILGAPIRYDPYMQS